MFLVTRAWTVLMGNVNKLQMLVWGTAPPSALLPAPCATSITLDYCSSTPGEVLQLPPHILTPKATVERAARQ